MKRVGKGYESFYEAHEVLMTLMFDVFISIAAFLCRI